MRMQQILGALLFCAKAVDPTILVAINALSLQQNNPTVQTPAGITCLLNYCVTYPNTVIRYHASGMVLHIHSNALYLTAPEGLSRAGGFFFLSSASKDPHQPPQGPAPLNGLVHNLRKVMCHVVTSASEAEVGLLRKGHIMVILIGLLVHS
eukprot:15340349-Ditylum_brightwellii.AAC.1